MVSVARTEINQVNYPAAKSDIDAAVSRYPKNQAVLSEAVFINLLVENVREADDLHQALKTTNMAVDEGTECLYYYGRNQSALATQHCEAAIHKNENTYTV